MTYTQMLDKDPVFVFDTSCVAWGMNITVHCEAGLKVNFEEMGCEGSFCIRFMK